MRISQSVFAILVGVGLSTVSAQGQSASTADSAESPYQLTSSQLAKAGFHLPSYMSPLAELMKYQDKVPTHQELHVQWTLFPGHSGSIPKEVADAMPLAASFELLVRKQRQPGIPGKTNLTLSEDGMIICAVTSQKEIRGLVIRSGFTEHAEDLRRGQQKSKDYVLSQVTFVVALPDDPQISTLYFLLPKYVGDHWKLDLVGSLALPAPNAATPAQQ